MKIIILHIETQEQQRLHCVCKWVVAIWLQSVCLYLFWMLEKMQTHLQTGPLASSSFPNNNNNLILAKFGDEFIPCLAFQ